MGGLDLKFMAARSKKDKTLEDTARVYTVPDGNFVNTSKITKVRHEFLILKSKLRDLNSRLGGCGICASEIYFLNFLKNNEGKRLK